MPSLNVIEYRPHQSITDRERDKARIYSHVAFETHKRRSLPGLGVRRDRPGHTRPVPESWDAVTVKYRVTGASGDDDREDEQMKSIIQQVEGYRRLVKAVFAAQSNHFSGSRVDPFGAISRRAAATVDSFVNDTVPSLAVAWKIFDVESYMPQSWLFFLQHEDLIIPVELASELAIGKAQPHSASFIKRHQIAISRVRKRLERQKGKPDAITVVAVNVLGIIAVGTGDMQSHWLHTKYIAPLVEAAGGIDHLESEGFVKHRLLQWESNRLLQESHATDTSGSTTGIRPRLFTGHQLEYTPIFPSFPFEPLAAQLVAKLPVGFQALAAKGTLSLRSLEALARCADILSGVSLLSSRELFHPGPRQFPDFFDSCPFLAPEFAITLERLIMQALILYSFNNMNPVRHKFGLYAVMRKDLTKGLKIWGAKARHDRGVLLWTYLNTLDSWSPDDSSRIPFSTVEDIWAILRQNFGDMMEATQLSKTMQLFFTNKKFEKRCLTIFKNLKLMESI